MSSDTFMPESEIESILRSHGFTIKGHLGDGAQGCVKLVVSDRDSLEYAVKITKASKFCAQEVESLTAVWNPYVINFFETFIEDGYRFQVLEYCPGGSLQSLVTQGILTQQRTYELCHQTLEAVRACHRKGIAHLDIKPQNILIDKYGRAKLADFGLSHTTTKRERAGCRGTFRYMAPEVLTGELFNPLRADIWSLGVTLYFLFHGELPWPQDKDRAMEMIMRGLGKASESCPADVAVILRRMVNVDPDERPGIDEVVACPAFVPPQGLPALLPLRSLSSIQRQSRTSCTSGPAYSTKHSVAKGILCRIPQLRAV
jgi:serine/threonine protein kinase